MTLQILLYVTGSATNHLLKVCNQSTVDSGTTWTDIAASTDLAESVGDLTEYLTVTRNIDPGTPDDNFANEDAALTAGTVRRMNWGNDLRVKVKQTEGTALDISVAVNANASW